MRIDISSSRSWPDSFKKGRPIDATAMPKELRTTSARSASRQDVSRRDGSAPSGSRARPFMSPSPELATPKRSNLASSPRTHPPIPNKYHMYRQGKLSGALAVFDPKRQSPALSERFQATQVARGDSDEEIPDSEEDRKMASSPEPGQPTSQSYLALSGFALIDKIRPIP